MKIEFIFFKYLEYLAQSACGININYFLIMDVRVANVLG